MRGHNPFAVHDGSLIASYSAKMAEAIAVRRASMAAQAARAEADMSIRARSQFLSNMNHELRTPLNAIIGFATMLREGETYQLSEDQQTTYAEYILQSADLLLGHINTILETAALDGGEITVEEGPLDLAVALGEAVSRAAVAAETGGVSVVQKGDKAGVEGWGDARRFAQAIDQLMRAAVRATPKGSRVLARAAINAKGWPEIAIRDHGTGLTREAIHRALGAFNEVHLGLDRSFAGPSIGLAVAKTVVEMQGGRFEIKSRLGQGTLVMASLPPGQSKSHDKPAAEAMRLAG